MAACLIAAARTPWAHRHGPLAATPPHVLLATALAGAVSRLDEPTRPPDRVLVACDTGVGAQDLNLARRAVSELGWEQVPALTVDGQGTAGLGLVGLACSLPGLTLVAGVDATSAVPPGAGLVRDYGRPTMDQPEVAWLEDMAVRGGLTPQTLDHAAKLARAERQAPPGALVTVETPAGEVAGDVVDERVLGDDLAPLVGPEGLQTARHLAEYADGAAAVAVQGGPGLGPGIVDHELVANSDPLGWLVERGGRAGRDEPLLLAEAGAVVLALVAEAGYEAGRDGVPSVLGLGCTPSANGLRMLVDAAHASGGSCTIVERGRHGQLASVTISSALEDRSVVS